MKRLLLLLTAAMALASSQLSAQGVLKLTIDDAVQLAIRSNKSLMIASRAIADADARIDDARASIYPKIDLNARYTRNVERPVFFFPGSDGITRPISVGSDNAIQADVTVNQVIFNSAAITAVGASETYAKISRQQLREQANEVVLNVRRAFYMSLLARDALDVNRALLANAEENYRTTQALYKGGLRSEFDAIRAEVQVANLKPVVVQGENAYRNAVDDLRVAIGLPPSESIELVGSLEAPAATSTEPSVEEARRMIEALNPGLAALRLSSQVSRELVEIERSDYLPTLAAFATYQYQAQADNFGALDFQPTAYVGLNLSLNLFNGGRTDAQVQQARIKAEQGELQLLQTGEVLATQAQGVLRSIGYARQRIEASEMTIGQAERGYTIAVASYKAGTGTQLQINDADLALAQSRLNRLSAVFDYRVAIVQLEGLLGNRVSMSDDDVQYRNSR